MRDFTRKKMTMSKIYKVIFNKNEIVVESNKNKTISKNKSEMNVIANDVLDCLNKAKELFFKQFSRYSCTKYLRIGFFSNLQYI